MEKSRVKIEASYTMAALGKHTPYAKLSSVKWQGREWAVEEIVVEPTSWSRVRSNNPEDFLLHSQYGAYVLSNGDEYTLAIISGTPLKRAQYPSMLITQLRTRTRWQNAYTSSGRQSLRGLDSLPTRLTTSTETQTSTWTKDDDVQNDPKPLGVGKRTQNNA